MIDIFYKPGDLVRRKIKKQNKAVLTWEIEFVMDFEQGFYYASRPTVDGHGLPYRKNTVLKQEEIELDIMATLRRRTEKQR